jgi:hypothetical protein
MLVFTHKVNKMKSNQILIGLALTTALGFSVPSMASLSNAGSGLINETGAYSLTWLADANTFYTQSQTNPNLVNAIIAANGGVINDTPNSLDTPANGGYYNLTASDFKTGTGEMNWWGAQAWVNYLNEVNYKGFSDWRLPAPNLAHGNNNGSTNDGNGSELGNLFWNELWNGNGTRNNTNWNLFTNITENRYWSSTEYAPDPRQAWYYNTFYIYQSYDWKSSQSFYDGWAVRSGNVAPVPIPACFWLFGSALCGLGIFRRSRAA